MRAIDKHWGEKLTVEDLPIAYQRLAKKIGLVPFLKVMRYFEGCEVYFPKRETAFKAVRDRVIRRKWNKINLSELAIEFNLTEVQIRSIVKEKCPLT